MIIGFLSKEDFGDLSQYKGLSPMECLVIVAAKEWEKEKRGKSKVVDLTEARSRVRGLLFQEPKIAIPMQEKFKNPCQRNKNDDKGVVKPPKRARNDDDDYAPGPSNRALQPKQKAMRPHYHHADLHDVKRVVIPENVKGKIAEMNGTGLNFVIEKKLTTTDMNEKQTRLSMPIIRCSVDLLKLIGGTDVSVDVIKPTKGLQVERLKFTKWVNSNSFMLNGSSPSWHEFVKSCGNLDVGDTIRVWTFRVPGGRHGFAIVKV